MTDAVGHGLGSPTRHRTGVTLFTGRVARWALVTFYGALWTAMLAPLLFAAVPPLIDYPNHLARMWILVHHGDIPELAGNYVLNWRILPDMGMDLIVPALAQMMPVVDAGRVFVALAMLGLVAGTATLHRTLHGRVGLWPVWAVLFVYNAVLFWGFVTCLFAVGLYLFAFSGWIASRRWPALPRLLVFAGVAALLFLTHVFAFGLYCLSVAAYELGLRLRLPRRRGLLKSAASYALLCLQFIPGLVLWYASLGNVKSAYTAYGSLGSKLNALFSPATFGTSLAPLDRLTWLAAALVLFFAISRGALKLAPEMRLPLAAMIVVALMMPEVANGSWIADSRIPVVLPFVLIAGTRLQIERRRLAYGLGLSAAICFGLRIWAVSQSWVDYGRWFDEFRQAAAVIAPGSKMLVVEDERSVAGQALPGLPEVLAELQPNAFRHMGALAVIDRAAYFPYLFTQATTVGVAPENREIAQTAGVPVEPETLIRSANPAEAASLDTRPDVYGQRPYWRDWPNAFDYVLWLDFAERRQPRPEQLSLLHAGSFFTLYRVVKR